MELTPISGMNKNKMQDQDGQHSSNNASDEELIEPEFTGARKNSGVDESAHSTSMSVKSQKSLSRGSRSFPPDPEDAATRKSVLFTVAGYIIVTEFCERLAYYGFAGSLVLFFQVQVNPLCLHSVLFD